MLQAPATQFVVAETVAEAFAMVTVPAAVVQAPAIAKVVRLDTTASVPSAAGVVNVTVGAGPVVVVEVVLEEVVESVLVGVTMLGATHPRVKNCANIIALNIDFVFIQLSIK